MQAVMSGAGALAISGAGALTLDDFTVSGTGIMTVPIEGVGSMVLDDFVVSGEGFLQTSRRRVKVYMGKAKTVWVLKNRS